LAKGLNGLGALGCWAGWVRLCECLFWRQFFSSIEHKHSFNLLFLSSNDDELVKIIAVLVHKLLYWEMFLSLSVHELVEWCTVLPQELVLFFVFASS
jgi:hypothetical protein